MPRDSLLGLLFPVWQLAIGGCVVVVVLLAGRRLVRRGPSRMGRALVVSGGAALILVALGVLLSAR